MSLLSIVAEAAGALSLPVPTAVAAASDASSVLWFNLAKREAITNKVLIERQQSVGVQWICGLAKVAGDDAEFGTNLADSLHVSLCGIRARLDLNEFEVGAQPGGLLHFGDRHADQGAGGMSDENVLNALAAGFADQQQRFGR